MSDGNATTFDVGNSSCYNIIPTNEDITNKKGGSSRSGSATTAAPSSSSVCVVDGHGDEDKGRRVEEGNEETEVFAAAAAAASSTSSFDNNTNDDDAYTKNTSRPINSSASRPSVLHAQTSAPSYLTRPHQGSYTKHSTRHQQQVTHISTRAVDTHVLDDVQDLKWKLYGKNIYFSIVFDAVIKIQAFVRGCLCRGKVADQIDELIQHLVKRREEKARQEKIWEQYRQQDILDREQRRLRNNIDGDVEEDNRRVTENVYKPWKKDNMSPSLLEEGEELSPFEELLLARNKTILKREDEQEEGEVTKVGRHMIRKFAVINEHSSTVGSDHSTVEIIDIEMSLKQRLKLWTSGNKHSIENNNSNNKNYNKRDDDEKKAELEQEKDEKVIFSEEHDDLLEVDSENDDQSNHMNATGGSTCDDNSSNFTDRHQNTSETASSISASGNQSVTSSIDTELRNNVKSNRQHDQIHGSLENRPANSNMGTVLRRKKVWNTDVRSESHGRNRKATKENYEEGISLDPITMLPTFIEDDDMKKTLPPTVVEPGEKGYSRYRSGTKGRNKQRPWRDDTDVFDAY